MIITLLLKVQWDCGSLIEWLNAKNIKSWILRKLMASSFEHLLLFSNKFYGEKKKKNFQPSKSTRSPAAGTTGSCESPEMGAMN